VRHPAVFNNFNQNFRDFVAYANILHRKGKADLAVLTGDIVDYIEPGRNFDHFDSDNLVHPTDNFQLLQQLVTGWPVSSGVTAGEELEIPYRSVGKAPDPLHGYGPRCRYRLKS